VTESTDLSASVVIVGSGMGGGTLAWGLAQRGIDCLVVERGYALPREPENWDPRAVFVDRRYKPSEKWSTPDGGSFAPGVHYVVGGNTKVYGSSLPRLRESDFLERRFPSGISPAWPFTYADLEPYYCDAEDLYRVHGDQSDPHAPWRSRPYPYPALAQEPYIEDLLGRLRDQGLHPGATSMGVDLREGGACIRCATCDGFPCQVWAKSDSEVCALRPAMDSGFVRLLEGMTVRRLESRHGRVVAAEGVRGTEHVRITGGVFVLAAGAANSAALLLRSASDEHPQGLANSTGLVGRNYMVHNNTHIAAVAPFRMNDVVFQKTAAVNDLYEDLGDGYAGGTLQLIGKVQGSMMKTHATKVPEFVLDRFADRSVEWLVMSEDIPDPYNRITLDSDGDIVVQWRRTNYDRHEKLLARAKSIFHRAGYPAVFEQRFTIDMNSHMCGTVVGGRDRGSSVLDPWCQAHEVRNLFVVDSAFFPSSGAQNPAMTIAAQALRVAAEVEWSSAA
jgi:choline dehydrogenase-like flavoprotein